MGVDGSPMAGRMIFLVGARRSGTNWLQRILEAHPSVAGIPSETYLFSHGLAPLVERFQHASPGSARTGFVHMDRPDLVDALRDFADRVFLSALETSDPGAERLVERTPWHARHLALIAELYPDAHVIHILRDGRDVARSLLSQDWGPDTMEKAATEWRDAVSDARRDAPLIGEGRYHEVRYEDMLRDPEDEIARLTDALGLEATPQALGEMVATAGVRFNVDTASPEIAAGKWRSELGEDNLRTFERVAGELLEELGYDRVLAKGAAQAPEKASRHPQLVRFRNGILRFRPSGGRGGGGEAAKVAGRENLRAVQAAQEIVDAFQSRIHTGDFAAAAALLAPGAEVAVSAGNRSWSATGEGARTRLEAALAADPALGGRHLSGDVHPAIPTFFCVSRYSLSGGHAHRATAITVSGGAITALHRYEL